jgi:outer membrane protein OmpA-like peptidoglycan-associated protein
MGTVLNSKDSVLLDTVVNDLIHAPAKVLETHPDLNLEIRGHCDAIEWEKDTLLSLKRAIAVRNYFIRKGVPKNRLVVIGYGKRELVNNCDIGKPCSEEKLSENRRISFKFISRN